jgi:rod shape-determining protein MreC
MPSGTDRSLSRRDTLLLLVCVGLSVGALSAPPAVGDTVANAIRRSVLAPFLWLQMRAEESRTSRAVVAGLRAAHDSAAMAAQSLPAVETENARLRALLGLGQRLATSYIAAEVLHQSLPTDGRTLILSVGEADGVRPFDPVVSPEGLIGVVRSVEKDRSVAMTWAHPEFRASAYAGQGEVFGIVAPSVQISGSEMLLQLRGVAYRDSIAAGTAVVTSGLGGVYPPGLPVGTVISHAEEATGWERVYLVRPAANPERVTHVLILLKPGNAAVGSAFQPDSLP